MNSQYSKHDYISVACFDCNIIMIEKIILNTGTDDILKRYSVAINDYTLPNPESQVVGNGISTYVITSENDHELRRMKFGFTPHWANERMDLLTARAEGDKNKGNDPYYNGPNSIFLKPAFKKAIQHYRCLIVADGFTCKVSGKEINIYTIEKPSVFAGIYDYWKDPETGLLIPGFTLITVPAVGKLCSEGISRMPVLLSFFNCSKWIHPEKPLSYYLPMLDRSVIEIASQLSFSPDQNKPTTPAKPVGFREMFRENHISKRERRGPPVGPDWGECKRMEKQNQNPE